jgi:aspartyl-tRNA(Asn)/glutamyl-tRNA(Gln) amidotransferase subunit B
MSRSFDMIASVRLIVGLEIHVELATRTKVFSRVANPAHASVGDIAPNTLIDPVVLALPGALPVLNKEAVEMSMMVGFALNCTIADLTKWDRKSYFYPDLPKAYQISQYDLPVCFDGSVDLPAVDDKGFPDLTKPSKQIGIIRAHLEEDAGKLLHEAPGGFAIDYSIADYNRAGTPLLEIVTQPDFDNADDVVLFAKLLRNVCRFLGVSEGVMQKGHMRFEPNINCVLTLRDGHTVKTPIVEVKNLNSFKSVKGAIEFELREQPARWVADGREFGPGTKVTRGWDDHANRTYVQREKEDAQDYRYFPDPDILTLRIDEAWKNRVRTAVPELPTQRFERYVRDASLGVKEAFALVEERDVCFFYEAIIDGMVMQGIERPRASKVAANLVLQQAFKRANEQNFLASEIGITAHEAAAIGILREQGKLGNQAVDELFDLLCTANLVQGRATDPGSAGSVPSSSQPPTIQIKDQLHTAFARVEQFAREWGLLIVRDDAAINTAIEQTIAANPKVAEDVRAGKVQAVGRLVGEVMKLAPGKGDAKAVREELLKRLTP